VDVNGRKVLITPHGELPGGTFLDPAKGVALDVDHKALTATESSEPLPAATLASLQAASELRSTIDAEMTRYVSTFLPSGVVTTYGSSGAGTKVVCCMSARASELNNYWAGLWLSEWTLEVPTGGSIGTLTGKVAVNVHYFEDGNVQLDDKIVFQCELAATPAEVGPAFVSKVKESEQSFMAKLEDIYSNLSESVLQGLRRRLPVTRMKFDWDKIAVAKLASDLQAAAGLK